MDDCPSPMLSFRKLRLRDSCPFYLRCFLLLFLLIPSLLILALVIQSMFQVLINSMSDMTFAIHLCKLLKLILLISVLVILVSYLCGTLPFSWKFLRYSDGQKHLATLHDEVHEQRIRYCLLNFMVKIKFLSNRITQ